MNCEQVRESISGYVDDNLSGILCQAIDNHIKRCGYCAIVLEQEQQLVQELADLPAPEPRVGFFEQALAGTFEFHDAQFSNRALHFMSAAACVLAGVLLTVAVQKMGFMPFSNADLPQGGNIETPLSQRVAPANAVELTVVDNQQLDIHLQVSVNNDIDDATMVIEVPQALQIVGFEDVNVLQWQVALKKGKNVLALPVKARRQFYRDHISHLVARLSTDKLQKDFDIKVTIKSSGQNGREALLLLRPKGDDYA